MVNIDGIGEVDFLESFGDTISAAEGNRVSVQCWYLCVEKATVVPLFFSFLHSNLVSANVVFKHITVLAMQTACFLCWSHSCPPKVKLLQAWRVEWRLVSLVPLLSLDFCSCQLPGRYYPLTMLHIGEVIPTGYLSSSVYKCCHFCAVI